MSVHLLWLQSKNGGVTAWEPARGQEWLEVRKKSHKDICITTFMRHVKEILRNILLLFSHVSVAKPY